MKTREDFLIKMKILKRKRKCAQKTEKYDWKNFGEEKN